MGQRGLGFACRNNNKKNRGPRFDVPTSSLLRGPCLERGEGGGGENQGQMLIVEEVRLKEKSPCHCRLDILGIRC